MVTLENVTKRFRTERGWKTVIDNVSLSFPTGKNIGILGRNGAGKSTLLRMLARAEYPNSGRIIQNVSLSWPIAFAGAFTQTLTGVDNVRFISRVYGADWRRVFEFVRDFTELGEYLHLPLSTYSAGMRARFSFALSMAVEFDCYLIDEGLATGDARFTERAKATFNDRRQRSNVILVSHNRKTIMDYCEVAYLLENGKLRFYDTIDAALEAYARG